MKSASYMSDRFAAFEIRALMRMTAKAAGRRVPSLKGPARKDLLEQYIDYTTRLITEMNKAERAAFRGDMYDRAFAVGKALGNLPGRKSDPAKTRLIRRLYRNIGIHIEGELPGEITIPRCAFSKSYTPEVCYVMSGMDAGIICGVFGGGSLNFEQRLTEGHPACRAEYRR